MFKWSMRTIKTVGIAMKVIFLDFDGVLNSVGSFIYNNRLWNLGLTKVSTHSSLDPVACSNLQYVLEECPDVQIVVSSTWRKYRDVSALQEVLKDNHILGDKIVGVTPESKDGYRGKEIESYLKNHPEITQFVIIDDNSDMEPYMDRLVKTDGRNGLVFTDAEKVIELFGGTNEKTDEI